MQKMLELSRENSLQSKELNKRILTLKKDVNVKGELVKFVSLYLLVQVPQALKQLALWLVR
jgi:hypothetical protein